jgi:hypothetical protein
VTGPYRDDREALIARLEARVSALEAEVADLRAQFEMRAPATFTGGAPHTHPPEPLSTVVFHVFEAGGERLVTAAAPVIRIGRSLAADVVVDDKSVSARHALVENRIDGVFVVDRGTDGGTLLNGKPVTRAILTDGDRLRVGQTLIRIAIRPPEERVREESPRSSVLGPRPERG